MYDKQHGIHTKLLFYCAQQHGPSANGEGAISHLTRHHGSVLVGRSLHTHSSSSELLAIEVLLRSHGHKTATEQ